jgi:hypothetical protein
MVLHQDLFQLRLRQCPNTLRFGGGTTREPKAIQQKAKDAFVFFPASWASCEQRMAVAEAATEVTPLAVAFAIADRRALVAALPVRIFSALSAESFRVSFTNSLFVHPQHLRRLPQRGR